MQNLMELNDVLSGTDAQSILRWSVDRFRDGLVLASSFGAEDMALIDMLCRITGSPRVFLLDTGRLHQETYDLIALARTRYRLDFEVYYPQTEGVERLLRTEGPNSFYESVEHRKECCRIRKVEPLARALSTADAWITGIRRDQSVTRSDVAVVEVDETHGGIAKINPLINWSEQDVWDYIRANDVPYNALHDRGFPSIGCMPCTRAIQPGEDLRAGRWWWESPEHKECGLHIKDGKVVRR